jgi:hypothetical protein
MLVNKRVSIGTFTSGWVPRDIHLPDPVYSFLNADLNSPGHARWLLLDRVDDKTHDLTILSI